MGATSTESEGTAFKGHASLSLSLSLSLSEIEIEFVLMGGHVWEAAAMVMVQVAFAGVNILYKLAINAGADLRILVAYRFLFATAFLAPLAAFIDRNSRPKMTWKIIIQIFLCGLFGGSVSQNLYVASMKMTSASFTTAMANLAPAITFVLAVFFRLESLGFRTISGQAKVAGTIVGVSGAMLLTFYKGPEVHLWSTSLHLTKSNHLALQESGNRTMGSLLAVASVFSYAIWLILQAKLAKAYPCHYSSTSLMCLMGSIQSVVFALCMQRDWKQWRMGFDIKLLTASYGGIVASGVTLTTLTWCIRRKGPLYAAVFNPLMLVMVTVFSSLMLDESLHVGSLLGASLIVIGLYAVLWGKGNEASIKVGELPSTKLVDVVIVPKQTTDSQGIVSGLGNVDDPKHSNRPS